MVQSTTFLVFPVSKVKRQFQDLYGVVVCNSHIQAPDM